MIRHILRLAVRDAVLCQGGPCVARAFLLLSGWWRGVSVGARVGAAVVRCVYFVCFFGTFLHILFMMSGGMALSRGFCGMLFLGSLLIGVGYAG